MSLVPVIGFTAAFLTTAAFIPQAWRAWRTKRTFAISLPAYLAQAAGMLFWLAYGVLIDDAPLIVSSIAGLAVAVAVLYLKIRYDAPPLGLTPKGKRAA